jgi:hypothetical protein
MGWSGKAPSNPFLDPAWRWVFIFTLPWGFSLPLPHPVTAGLAPWVRVDNSDKNKLFVYRESNHVFSVVQPGVYTKHILRYAGSCGEVKQITKLSTEVTHMKTNPCYVFLRHLQIDRYISGIYLFTVHLKILLVPGTIGRRKPEWLADISLMQCWKVRPRINLKCCAGICVVGLRSTTMKLNHCPWCSSRESSRKLSTKKSW